MNRTSACLAVALVALMLTGGCFTAAKEGLGFVTGPKGSFIPLQAVSTARSAYPLAEYTRFELGEIRDDFGRTPGELLRLLPGYFHEQLLDKGLPNRPGKTLLVRGWILHYEGEDMLGSIIGPIEQVIVRTELVDKDSSQVLGVANVIGRTTNRVNLGIEEKAEGLAKGLVAWIDSRYPPTDSD